MKIAKYNLNYRTGRTERTEIEISKESFVGTKELRSKKKEQSKTDYAKRKELKENGTYEEYRKTTSILRRAEWQEKTGDYTNAVSQEDVRKALKYQNSLKSEDLKESAKMRQAEIRRETNLRRDIEKLAEYAEKNSLLLCFMTHDFKEKAETEQEQSNLRQYAVNEYKEHFKAYVCNEELSPEKERYHHHGIVLVDPNKITFKWTKRNNRLIRNAKIATNSGVIDLEIAEKKDAKAMARYINKLVNHSKKDGVILYANEKRHHYIKSRNLKAIRDEILDKKTEPKNLDFETKKMSGCPPLPSTADKSAEKVDPLSTTKKQRNCDRTYPLTRRGHVFDDQKEQKEKANKINLYGVEERIKYNE